MAQSSGNVSNIVSFGGVDTSSNLTIPEANAQGYFSLNIGQGATSTNQYSPFYKNGVAYQVPAGKTCYVVGITACANSLGAGSQLVHSMSVITANAVTITSGVYQGGAAGLYVILSGAVTQDVPTHWAYPYSFPSLAYPGAQLSALNYALTLICKEI